MLGFVWDRVNGWGTRKLVGLYDILGVQINPATEDKQDDIISATGGFNIGVYDYVSVAYSDPLTEVYSFYVGPTGSRVLTSTITVTYTNSSKDYLSNAEKT